MPKYRKKPVVIEAVQFTSNNNKELGDFLGRSINPFDPQIGIDTLEGVMTANKGDFIIKGIQGEFYPCKLDIFEKSYELVD